eukprot:jgi/Psemu1/7703/gm1.7703_g
MTFCKQALSCLATALVKADFASLAHAENIRCHLQPDRQAGESHQGAEITPGDVGEGEVGDEEGEEGRIRTDDRTMRRIPPVTRAVFQTVSTEVTKTTPENFQR